MKSSTFLQSEEGRISWYPQGVSDNSSQVPMFHKEPSNDTIEQCEKLEGTLLFSKSFSLHFSMDNMQKLVKW